MLCRLKLHYESNGWQKVAIYIFQNKRDGIAAVYIYRIAISRNKGCIIAVSFKGKLGSARTFWGIEILYIEKEVQAKLFEIPFLVNSYITLMKGG